MRLIIELELDNDAMLWEGEISNILAGIGHLAEDSEGRVPPTKVRDVNGNTVGTWEIKV